MAREMLCFTIETAVGGRAGRRLRLCSPMVGCVRSSPHCNGGSQVCGAVFLGNAIADC